MGSAKAPDLPTKTQLTGRDPAGDRAVVVGSGRRLFTAGGTPAGLQLIRHEKTPGGLAIHEYKTVGAPVTGVYEPV